MTVSPDDGGDDQQQHDQPEVERAERRERPRRKEQRVARQERGDHEPGLAEDDQKQDQVGPGAVLRDQLAQVLVQVQKEIDDARQQIHARSPVGLFLAKAELADQRHEANVGDGAGPDPVTLALDQGQRLGRAIAQRDDHASAGRQLFHQWSRHLRRGGRHQNGVIGRERAPSQGAVSHQHRHIANAGRREGRPRALGQPRRPAPR